MALPNFGNYLFKALGIKYNIFDLNTVWYAYASVKKATFCGVAFFIFMQILLSEWGFSCQH